MLHSLLPLSTVLMANISFFFSGGELVSPHKVLVPGVVFADVHNLALSIIEGNSPFVCSFT
jgi:hypothetical protein